MFSVLSRLISVVFKDFFDFWNFLSFSKIFSLFFWEFMRISLFISRNYCFDLTFSVLFDSLKICFDIFESYL